MKIEYSKQFDSKNNTYFFEGDIHFKEKFKTNANLVIFGNVTCDDSIEAYNIVVHGTINAHYIKSDRIFCANLFAHKIAGINIKVDNEIIGDILYADDVKCNNLDIQEEITAKRIESGTTQIYGGQMINCKHMNTYKYYN